MVSLTTKYVEMYSNRQNIETCILINQTELFLYKISQQFCHKIFAIYKWQTEHILDMVR